MSLTEDQSKAIESMAYSLMPIELIAINLQIPTFQFVEEIRALNSPISIAYYKGYIRQLMETRNNFINAAKNGSNPALEKILGFIKDINNQLKHE